MAHPTVSTQAITAIGNLRAHVIAADADVAQRREVRRRQIQVQLQALIQSRQTPDAAESGVTTPRADVDPACCVICLSGMVVGETLVRLGCGHLFHKECTDEWYANLFNESEDLKAINQIQENSKIRQIEERNEDERGQQD